MNAFSAFLHAAGWVAVLAFTVKTWIGAGGIAALVFFVAGVIAMAILGSLFRGLDGGENALKEWTAQTTKNKENPYR